MASPRRPQLTSIIDGIREGRYDKSLSTIATEIDNRRTAIVEEVEKLVQDTLGQNWKISDSDGRRNPPGIGPYKNNDPGIELVDDEEVIKAPKPLPEDDPLTEEDESRSPVFGSIEIPDGMIMVDGELYDAPTTEGVSDE